MEKIKITVEQEKALSSYVKLFETLDNTPFKNFIEKDSPFKGMYNVLNGFTPEQFSLLLCGWYEIEKPFKVGDWVVNKANKQEYAQVIATYSNALVRVKYAGNDDYVFEVEDDVWMFDSEEFIEEYALPDFESGRVKIFFPVEKGIEVKG